MSAQLELTEVSIERPEQHVVSLEVEIAANTVTEKVRSVYRQLSREANIPGFRKGHAPRELLRRFIGPEKIRRQVTDELVPAAYDQVLKEQGLEPIERANVEVVEFGEDRPLKFKARVTVKPEIQLGDYIGVPVVQPPRAVTDEEISAQLEGFRESHAILKEVETRGIQSGDVITSNLEVAVEGEQEVRKRELGPVEVGAGNLVPSIDAHLLGAGAGETRTFSVRYPDDYNDESLRGKDARFTAQVTSIKEKVLPELNDDFAREVDAEFETLDALKDRIRERLQATRDAQARAEARRQVVEAVVERASVEFSSSWMERRVNQRFQRLVEDLTQRNITLDEYLEAQKTNSDDLKARFHEDIARESKRELVLEAIGKKEGIQIDASEVNAELVALARNLNQDVNLLGERMIRNGTIRGLEIAVFERKVGEWLLERAHMTSEPPSEESVNLSGQLDMVPR